MNDFHFVFSALPVRLVGQFQWIGDYIDRKHNISLFIILCEFISIFLFPFEFFVRSVLVCLLEPNLYILLSSSSNRAFFYLVLSFFTNSMRHEKSIIQICGVRR